MKKMFVVMATLLLTLMACADEHEMVKYSELPASAQSFIQKYYAASDVSYVELDREGFTKEYNVYLKSGVEMEFDAQGNLLSIDCGRMSVPEGIIPSLIVDYVNLHHPSERIVEYQVEYRRLKVGLSNDWELMFDMNGNFLAVDN
jgi:hypothetical protein